uniref:DUF155 domain-containing protein n=1 Tax=Caenorhabditis tropicalis TaxID=1561998 RepID=A0A1I7TBL8_9PELO
MAHVDSLKSEILKALNVDVLTWFPEGTFFVQRVLTTNRLLDTIIQSYGDTRNPEDLRDIELMARAMVYMLQPEVAQCHEMIDKLEVQIEGPVRRMRRNDVDELMRCKVVEKQMAINERGDTLIMLLNLGEEEDVEAEMDQFLKDAEEVMKLTKVYLIRLVNMLERILFDLERHAHMENNGNRLAWIFDTILWILGILFCGGSNWLPSNVEHNGQVMKCTNSIVENSFI